jgi:hypothetical protein
MGTGMSCFFCTEGMLSSRQYARISDGSCEVLIHLLKKKIFANTKGVLMVIAATMIFLVP